jgi:glycosyltransferase involved in cell wall biosynthesis
MPSVLNIGVGLGPRYGGPGMSLEDMWGAVARQGWDVTAATIFHPDDWKEGFARDLALRCGDGSYHRIPFSCTMGRFEFSSALMRWIAGNIARFDIVHLHSLFTFPVAFGGLTALWRGRPFVLTPHGVLDRVQRQVHPGRKRLWFGSVGRIVPGRAAAIICSSAREVAEVKEMRIAARAVFITNGVAMPDPVGLPPAGHFRQRYLNGESGPIVLYLGRLNPKKGLDLLIPAFARVLESHPSARLAVVGGCDPPEYEAELRATIARVGVAEKIFMTGVLTGAEKLAAFVDSDLFVLPSRSENFATALFEAMACGTPVVISKGVDLWPEVHAAGAGLAAELDCDRLTDSISALLGDPASLREMAKNGRALARRYSWDRTAEHLIALYRQIMEGRAAQACSIGQIGLPGVAEGRDKPSAGPAPLAARVQ